MLNDDITQEIKIDTTANKQWVKEVKEAIEMATKVLTCVERNPEYFFSHIDNTSTTTEMALHNLECAINDFENDAMWVVDRTIQGIGEELPLKTSDRLGLFDAILRKNG